MNDTIRDQGTVLHTSVALGRYAEFFAAMRQADVERMGTVMTPAVHFRDPFNDLHDLEATQTVFRHMFEACQTARFTILDQAAADETGFLLWRLDFRLRRWQPERERQILGTSHVRFAPDGRAHEHRDYWDAGQQVYEQIPVLGALLRQVRKRLG